MIDPSFLRKKNYSWRFPVIAVLFHIAVLGGLILLEIHFRREMIKDEIKKILQVKQITQEELDILFSRDRVIETNGASSQNVKIQKNQKAFFGEKTQRVKKETVAVGKATAGQDAPMQLPRKANISAIKIKSGTRKVLEKQFGSKVTSESKSLRNTGPTYDILALDPTLSISPRTFLNTDNFVYAGFSNRLREKIGVPWTERATRAYQSRKNEISIGIYLTIVKYFITEEGKITKAVVTRESGIAEFDKAALDSVLEAKVIQNPPHYLFKPPFDGSLEYSFYNYVVPGRNFYFNFFPDDRLDKAR